MITLVLSSCPSSLRGHLTRWLTEVSANVFVGKVTPRIREKIWTLVTENLRSGRAIMTFPSRESEQGYDFEVLNHEWEVVDADGLKLVRRPRKTRPSQSDAPKPGWSRAGRKRRFGR
ncbi:type I-E CRISPR-associated endoribonuclease Cas2e [Corynebacterium phocae]|uniref:type I-E CRISPR-associated endoribonuclease Cas2e n=1 Tax=Corynebacterium phocae TaxID=161895 RepID=UPI0009525935|nr:type I-E CRISPR-associated endoribonuclease Cas2e [Corynebacterium phocae]KAA8721561.1 type I-E CRISPR-associated endoribonuclease Cas2 [Corynebacterium phocae]